jgi:hypothetical protein
MGEDLSRHETLYRIRSEPACIPPLQALAPKPSFHWLLSPEVSREASSIALIRQPRCVGYNSLASFVTFTFDTVLAGALARY